MSRVEPCHYCHLPRGSWNAPCPNAPDGLHWTAFEKIAALEAERLTYIAHLRRANRLLLAGARAMEALRVRGWRARRRALAALPSSPDALDLETEAAKMSDTIAVYAGDPSLPVGSTFDRLEGR